MLLSLKFQLKTTAYIFHGLFIGCLLNKTVHLRVRALVGYTNRALGIK